MAFKITKWEFSDDIEVDTPIPEGLRAVHIDNAYYDPEKYTYVMELTDLELFESFKLTYWLYSANQKTGKLEKSKTTVGTLNSLGKAIFGPDMNVGVPAPADVCGAVVIAEIKNKTSETSGRTYPRCYHFMPANASMKGYSEIEQYYTA